MTTVEIAATAATGVPLGLPHWPAAPEPVDPSAASVLVLALGGHPRTAEVAGAWVREAEGRVPTRLVVADDLASGHEDVVAALDAVRIGVRIMVVGPQHDVLLTLARCRAHGASGAELRAFVVDAEGPTDLPVYCAHCRATHRLHGEPGGTAVCPGCTRLLEIHPHHSAVRGSFLASDTGTEPDADAEPDTGAEPDQQVAA